MEWRAVNKKDDLLVVVTSVGTEEQAIDIAHALIRNRQAACVNLMPNVHSIYRWKGRVCDDGVTVDDRWCFHDAPPSSVSLSVSGKAVDRAARPVLRPGLSPLDRAVRHCLRQNARRRLATCPTMPPRSSSASPY